MTKNFTRRLITSIFLLIILFIVIYSHQLIFGLSLLILGFIVCIEFNNISRKLVGDLYLSSAKLNIKFFILENLTSQQFQLLHHLDLDKKILLLFFLMIKLVCLKL